MLLKIAFFRYVPFMSYVISQPRATGSTQAALPGSWKPLEATEFEGLAKGVEALQFLQRAQQIGKAPSGFAG